MTSQLGTEMSKFTDTERAFFTEMRAIAVDANGQSVLIGLTEAETQFYLTYSRGRLSGVDDLAGGERYLELHDKHERSRLAVIVAEVQLRNDGPTRH